MSFVCPIAILAATFVISILYKWMTRQYGHLDLLQISRKSLVLSIALALPIIYLGSCTWNEANANPAMQDTLWLTGRDFFLMGIPMTLLVLDFSWSNWDEWWAVALMAGALMLQWILWGQLLAVTVFWQGHHIDIIGYADERLKKKLGSDYLGYADVQLRKKLGSNYQGILVLLIGVLFLMIVCFLVVDILREI